MTEPRDVRTLWQTQPTEGGPMSIDEVRSRARALDRKVRRQDAIMMLSGVINTAAFIAVMWYLPQLRIVAAIVLATVFAIVIQYVRRRPSRRQAIDDLTSSALNPCVEFYRHALLRKRDMAGQLGSWFLPPAILGQVALIVGFVIAPPDVPRRMILIAVPFWILTTVTIFVVAWRNAQREARKMQRELDSLDLMTHTS